MVPWVGLWSVATGIFWSYSLSFLSYRLQLCMVGENNVFNWATANISRISCPLSLCVNTGMTMSPFKLGHKVTAQKCLEKKIYYIASIQCQATIGPPAKRHSNGVSRADR